MSSSTPTAIRILTTALLAGVVTSLATHAAADPSSATYTVAVSGATPYTGGLDTPVNPFIDKDGSFHAETAVGGYGATESRVWTFLTGHNLDDAARDTVLSTANGDTTERCDNSPTGVESTDPPAGSGYSQRNFCDLNGVWVDPDTGDWYGLVHNEFTPQPFGDGLHYDAIDYAVSTDQGLHWTIKDHAITSPYSTKRGDTTAFPNETYYYGDGDPRLLVDTASGYFYVFYGSRVVDKAGSWKAFYEHVARAPIAGKLAKGTWQKWYDGHWTQPGIGGKESNLTPVTADSPTGYTAPDKEYDPTNPGTSAEQIAAGTMPSTSPLFVMDVTYDAYLGLYLAEPQAIDQSGNAPQEIYATDNLATQKWTKLGDTGSYHTASWYRWFLDGANATSSTIVGKTLRAYCNIGCTGATTSGEYVDLTIDSGTVATSVVDGGTYEIANGNGLVLLQGTKDQTTSARGKGGAKSTWTFTANGDGSYAITNAQTGDVLGVPVTSDATRAWGTRPVATTPGAVGSVGQQWFVVPNTSPSTGAATGTFRLVNRYSGLVLGLSSVHARQAETTPLRAWSDTSGSPVGGGRTAAEQTLTLRRVG